MDVSLRNSMVSRQTFGVALDSLITGGVSHVEIANSELTNNTTGVHVANTTATAQPRLSIVGSQLYNNTDAIIVTNNAIGGNTTVQLDDTTVASTGNGGIALANSAPDNNTRIFMEMARSQISNITTTALDINATNGSKIEVTLRDSRIAHAASGVNTAGTAGGGGYAAVSLVRSEISSTTIAVNHGFGTVRLDGSHIVYNFKDLVNNGSGSIVSNGYNMLHDNTDPAGPVYITPSVILLK
jgi:hypothetical protein